MKIDIKRWNKEIEEKIIEELEKEGKLHDKQFKLDGRKVFVVDTPPPYSSPTWHIGAVIAYSFTDVIVRSKRMLNYNVLYPIPFDNNGLPVEWYVEKYEGKTIFNTSREEFVKLCSNYLKQWTSNMKAILKRCCLSGIYDYYWTDYDDYRLFTQRTFIDLWKKGLIYIGKMPINFCTHCKTTIADSEIEYKEVKGKLYYIKFKLKDSGKDIIIATTRPELLGACQVIIFNPKDERYKDLEGKTAIVPLYNKEVKIVKHEYADPNFGTGLVMICSYGDANDVKILRELNVKGEVIIGKDIKMHAKFIEGLSVEEAKEKIVEELRKENLIVEEVSLTHKIPVHDKCGRRVEIIEVEEYFLKQVEFKEEMLKIAEKLNINKEKYRQRLIDWIKGISMDWPISRERFYGTEIPVWKCEKCNYIYVPEKLNRYVKPWKEEIDKKCPKCGGKLIGETKVFDTWFDSSNTILYLCKLYDDKNFFDALFNKGFKLRPQGYEIIRTWLYYTLLKTYLLTKKIAFDYVFVNGMGLDEKGKKMSKSKGNIIDPWEIFNEYGSDALRFWIASETSISEDYRISKEKISSSLKFLNKILNIAKYVSQFNYTPIEENNLKASDKWIIANLKELYKKAIDTYEKMNDYLNLGRAIRKFVELFSSHYIELSKKRAFENDKGAIATLHYCLRNFLKIIAPITPLISYYIYNKLYNKNIHEELFEEIKFNFEDYLNYNEELTTFNSTVWKKKKEGGKSLKDGIEIEIPEKLKEFKEDLVACHNIK